MGALLSEMLDTSCIELELKERRKPELIRELAEILSRCGAITDIDSLVDEIMERENLSSTGIGSGIAIPHCLTSQVSETRIAFGRKTEGARFDAVDNRPVALFFLLVGPKGDYARHMQILSKIARYLHDPRFCQDLLAAESPEDILKIFRRKEGS
ncbi:MAG: PTS sugar transporter subunit IIA [Spirochaetales bacterium]|nr:PTS sugar transporter subunit IIA [Spirochaetales bacterium]